MAQRNLYPMAEACREERMEIPPKPATELWHLIVSTTKSAQELLLARTSLIDALPPREIYALHPDQFANVTTIYRMKHNLFKRLQHNQTIERLCSEGKLAPNGDT
jgi:hypothetical protein